MVRGMGYPPYVGEGRDEKDKCGMMNILHEVNTDLNGPVEIHCEGWPVPKIFVMRKLSSGDRVSEKVNEAALEFLQLFKDAPQFAYISRLPNGVENGVEVDGVMLFEAEWMPPRMVAVGWTPSQPPQNVSHLGEE